VSWGQSVRAAAARAVSIAAFSIRLVFEASPRLSAILVALIAVDAVLPIATLKLTSDLVRSGPQPGRVMGYVAALAGLALGQRLLQNVRDTVREAAQDRITTFVQGRLILAANARPGLEWFEDPRYHDRLARSHVMAQQGPLALVAQGTLVLQASANVLFLLAAVATLNPWLAFLLLVTHLPQMSFEYRFASAMRTGLAVRGEEGRKLQYATGVFWDPAAARDCHLLRLRGFFLDQHRRAFQAIMAEIGAGRRRAASMMVASSLLGASTTGAVCVAAVSWAVLGRTDVGTLTLVIGAAIGLEAALSAAGFNVGAFGFMMAWLPDVMELIAPAPLDEGPARSVAVPAEERGIRFEGVSYTYPGGEDPAVRDVSFTIRPGELVGLVGPNGAGKSTIVKLLLGLYQPSGGRILVDGVDLRHLDTARWRASLTGVFQDFMRYSFTCRENIGLGSLGDLDDREAIQRAAEAGGAAVLIGELPDGLETPLTARFGGIELSGGQWQRVALSRGAMRRQPEIAVLDEPTGAIDARQEHELFRRWSVLPARTVLLVTHRVGLVRLADRVLIMDGGRLLEHGSPADLAASGGRYADLDRLQRTQYEQPDGPSAGGNRCG
jgi:ATP-binding cassette, subfamily B, bacterial